MNLDIEKLKRKTPYTEPTDEFFKSIQDKVIAKTIDSKNQEVKEAKVFALDFRWMAAAAVILIGGIVTFFSVEKETELMIADNTMTQVVSKVDKKADVLLSPKVLNVKEKIAVSKTNKLEEKIIRKDNNEKKSSVYIVDRQEFSNTRRSSENEVDKVLVAFTPDQLKDIEKNSEQDLYLDLYY